MKSLITMLLITSIFSCSLFKKKDNTITHTDTNITSNENIWTDYVIGKPYIKAFEAREKIAKKWKINYTYIFAGCDANKKSLAIAEDYAASNKIYFKKLEKIHGEDWKERFDKEVDKITGK